MIPQTYVLADGRQLKQLSAETFKLLGLNGEPLRYLRAEHVEYRASLEAQWLAQRFRQGAPA